MLQFVAGFTEGGVFLQEAYTVRQLEMPEKGGPPVPEMMFSAQMLKDDFQSLEIIQAWETDRDINEGIMHQGLSAVVQLIAKRV